MNTLQLFTGLLIVQIFWSFGVSIIVPNMINANNNQVVLFTNEDNIIEIDTLANSVKSGITDQTSVPLLEVGALIFYSSSTILNLMINFFTAIPQMITLLLNVFFLFIPIDTTLQLTIKTWVFGIITILYFMSLFAFITGTRTNISGGGIL